MTPSACSFITPLTLSTLSKHEVHTEVSDGSSWNNHVDMGLWADAMIVAPTTATTLAKMANGIATYQGFWLFEFLVVEVVGLS